MRQELLLNTIPFNPPSEKQHFHFISKSKKVIFLCSKMRKTFSFYKVINQEKTKGLCQQSTAGKHL